MRINADSPAVMVHGGPIAPQDGTFVISNDAANFIGDIPEHYDRGLGPMIFADYAADSAGRAADRSPARVLETAAGTGIVTRQLRSLPHPRCSSDGN